MKPITIEQRPGKLWAVLQHPLSRILIAFAAIVLFAAPVFIIASSLHLHGIAGAGVQLLVGLGTWGIYLVYVRLLERRSATELALSALPRQFGAGFLIGAALFSATVLVLWSAGVYSVQGMNPAETLLAPFIGALGAALLEEIAVRGVLFRIIEEKLGSWGALMLTALIFGLMHGLNHGATWISVLAIALEAGVLLAAAYVYARSLWLSIGMHCAWNFTEAGVFGASVSGGKPHGLLAAQFSGPDWLTGGPFGPEASLPAVLVCLATAVLLLLLAQRRGHIMAPFWKRTG